MDNKKLWLVIAIIVIAIALFFASNKSPKEAQETIEPEKPVAELSCTELQDQVLGITAEKDFHQEGCDLIEDNYNKAVQAKASEDELDEIVDEHLSCLDTVKNLQTQLDEVNSVIETKCAS